MIIHTTKYNKLQKGKNKEKTTTSPQHANISDISVFPYRKKFPYSFNQR